MSPDDSPPQLGRVLLVTSDPLVRAGLAGLLAGSGTVVSVEPGARVEVRYATPAELKLAQDKEFRHGGVFVPGEHGFERGTEVTLLMRLDFCSTALEVAASVVHVYDGSQARPRGIGLMFKDKKEVDDALASYLQ